MAGEGYAIYCDESCHLEHDQQRSMILGAVWCPDSKRRDIAVRIREIKVSHGLPPWFEVKWGKVSPAQQQLYIDLLDYFFDDDDLHFRALIVPDKAALRHDEFDQDHDEFYFKMYFDMLKLLLSNDSWYRIYLDIKDTQSGAKVAKLHEVLSNSKYDFERRIVRSIQTVRSHEVEQVQITDLLIGAVSYANRGLSGNVAKEAVVGRMQSRSGFSLTRSTLMREQKVNIFRWEPSVRAS